jgi:DNA-binding response OmpR family regulator
MNDPPSDGNESVIDIFVLSVSETVVPLLTEHLEKKGYRVTLFTDGTYLLETLRTGKPNLLICDSTTLDEEGFEVCRQIKADDDFWVIPVLILTRASTLTDLLQVLDCNADNFVPHPFDLSYSLSIIESMLGTPVERQTPEQIKTQFKISHDDRIYVVAANRRKLLEFLLSSFEIGVSKSSELSRVSAELQTLSESAINLEDTVTEQTRVIDTLQASLRQKEQKISTLTHEVEEKKKLLEQKTGEIEQFTEKLDHHKALIVTNDSHIRNLIQEKKEIETSYCSEIEILRQQISELTNEVDTAKTILDNVQADFEAEKIHCTSLECTLELLAQQKELAETSLRAISDEHNQLISAFEAEKDRGISAEQELKSVMQAKLQSEQELAGVITALNETKTQLDADLIRLKQDLETEAERRISAEHQLVSFKEDREQSETSLRSSIAALQEQLGDLREQLKTTRTALENEENTTRLLQENLAEAVAENERTEARVKADLESYKTTFVRLRHDLEEATAIPKTLERDLDAARIQNKLLADELNLANRSRAQSVEQAHALADELEKVKATLDAERNLHQAGDKSFEELMQTKKSLEQDLRSSAEELEKLNKILENERRSRLNAEDASKAAAQEREQLKSELYAVTSEQERQEKDRALKIQNLEREFELVCNLQKSLEEQVNILTKEKLEAEKTLKSLTDELDQARIALADEWVDHVDSDKSSVAAGEASQIQKRPFSQEETTGITTEPGSEIVEKEADLPVIVRSSSQALAMVASPDIQKSQVSENELAPSEQSRRISEVSSEAVTDIVKTFCDEDLYEENEPDVTGKNLSSQSSGVDETEQGKIQGSEKFPDAEYGDEDTQTEPETDYAGKISGEPGAPVLPGTFSLNRKQWFDLLKWAHHSTTLTHDQRLQIVRMGRLIQKDRKLTRKQEEQVKEMIALVQALGYRPS